MKPRHEPLPPDRSGATPPDDASASESAAHALAEVEYRTIVETAIDGFVVVDLKGRIREVNGAYCQMSGYRRDELLAMGILDLAAPESFEAQSRALAELPESGAARFETQQRRKDGSPLELAVSVRFLPLRGGVLVGFVEDIGARKLAEAERRQDAERLERLVAERTASLTEAMRETEASRLAALETMENAVEARQRVERLNAELNREIAERRRAEAEKSAAEEQLVQIQKFEAIGRLAGGIAHDFNNILGVISGFGELALEELPAYHPSRSNLEEMMLAARRAAELTHQLLAFSRKQVMRPRSTDLDTVVAELQSMLRPLIGEDIDLSVRSTAGLGRVMVDPAQMQQVLLNLAVNARDAMPRGGRLTIETANSEFAADYVATHSPAVPGRFVLLAVSDTGIGMDAETQRRCFEPFFTTKSESSGTGLGLATVYGIVKQSGGYIWVYSEPGQGTTFKVYLPRIDLVESDEVEESLPAPAAHGDETVLVVEDMDALREMIRRSLEREGYSILLAPDGEAALELAREHRSRIDLLLTDVVMPKVGGAELAKEIAALHAGIRVLYMSGYTAGAISQQGILADGVDLIEKPFSRAALALAVRQVLDRPAPE